MSAAYIVSGIFVGALVARVRPGEGGWGWLIIPAAIALIVGWCLEERRR